MLKTELFQSPIVKQTHTIHLSQRQSLEILSLSSPELLELAKKEQLENPLLELDSSSSEPDTLPMESMLQWLDMASPKVENGIYIEDEKERTLAYSQFDFHAELLEQLCSSNIGRSERSVCECLLPMLDEHGFLPYSIKELSVITGFSEGMIAHAKEILFQLEPNGVGFYNVGEYLLFQLKEKQIEREELTLLCQKGLSLVASGKIRECCELTSLSSSQLKACLRLIETLNPYPLQSFSQDSPTEYLTPDLIVREIEGRLVVETVRQSFCELRISPSYSMWMNANESEVREYIQTKLKRASFLITAIAQRNQTLLQIGTAITEIQRGFFQGKDLLSIGYREIAQKLSIHPSTVARAIKGKYLQCKRGLYPLKSFFPSGVAGSQGEHFSRNGIEEHLIHLIQSENRQKPFSDEQLSKLLHEKGILVSRRTVAKYRLEKGIKSASERKQRKEDSFNNYSEWN